MPADRNPRSRRRRGQSGRGSGRLRRSVPCPGENPRPLPACKRWRAERRSQSSPTREKAQLSAVWCGKPAIRSMLMLAMPASRRRRDLFENSGAFVQPSDGLRFAIDERLHAQAHPVHSALQQGFDERGSQRARSAFDGDLGIGRDRKLIAHGGEDAQQLRGIEDGRSSSAEIDGVGSVHRVAHPSSDASWRELAISSSRRAT